MPPLPHLMLLLSSHCLPRQPVCLGSTWASCLAPTALVLLHPCPPPSGALLPASSSPLFSALCLVFVVLLCRGELLNPELIKSAFPELWGECLSGARLMCCLRLGMERGMQLAKVAEAVMDRTELRCCQLRRCKSGFSVFQGDKGKLQCGWPWV